MLVGRAVPAVRAVRAAGTTSHDFYKMLTRLYRKDVGPMDDSCHLPAFT